MADCLAEKNPDPSAKSVRLEAVRSFRRRLRHSWSLMFGEKHERVVFLYSKAASIDLRLPRKSSLVRFTIRK